MIHQLAITAANLHGHFSAALAPVLEIEPGDTVNGRTLDSGWGEIEQSDPFAKPTKFAPRDVQRDPGHALCGPILIAGANAGMTLEVEIVRLVPGNWGWSGAGGYPSPLNTVLGVADAPECVMRWSIDPERSTAINQDGRRIKLSPFLGILGMPPDAPGSHSTFPPRPCGGNIDCRELTVGSRLFLPISVDGCLFSFGDGHAVQGDGEVSGPALECPMDQVELAFRLHDGPARPMPWAETPDAFIAFGLHAQLDEAAHLALGGMLDLIVDKASMTRKEALALASLAVDLRVTQIVNGTKGIHAMLSKQILQTWLA